ncbi:hypothetical protein MVEN_01717200 [Mycena venus]|uniref:RlpA-like protein double-psi beta-barrel domain-containing protein n=1 Tax=Mycena venus TaxID=2733690 RepID=A0A8H7CNH0_9AGAR|nr:hypothetical protein MVEN_01717200 [Mycena venus]
MQFSKTLALLATVFATDVGAASIREDSSITARAAGDFWGMYCIPQKRDVSGVAGLYSPDGAVGACGLAVQNTDLSVALGSDTFAGGALCGQSVNVQFNGITIEVLIVDRCVGCVDNDIDLTPSAIAVLDPSFESGGTITVTWGFN